MDVRGQNIVITGAASGIGRGLAERFAELGAANLVVSDLVGDGAHAVADPIGATVIACDVADPDAVESLVQESIAAMGHIDLFCSNAGVGVGGGLFTSDSEWELAMGVNMMAHVYAARSVVPHMIERGGGYLLQTVSSAGLVTGATQFPYAVSKHAALAVAEWLAVNHGGDGIKVMTLNPSAVDTPMMARIGDVPEVSIPIDDVVDATVAGLAAESFLICPDPDSLEQFQAKAASYDEFLVELGQAVRKPS